MGVNWQNNEYYRTLIKEERNTGFSVADRNRIANPYGNHSFGGLLISQLLPQLLMGGAEKLGAKLEGSSDTGSATDIKQKTQEDSNLGFILSQFNKAIEEKDPQKIDSYLKELETLKNKYPNVSKYQDAYANALAKKQNNGIKT